jgi:hypothetical protein
MDRKEVIMEEMETLSAEEALTKLEAWYEIEDERNSNSEWWE